jgi:hypothetical protein
MPNPRPARPARSGLRALLVGLWIATGCTSVAVDADWNTQARFDALSTWAWLTEPTPPTESDSADTAIVRRRIQNAVDAELGARGYRRVEDEAPDFYVAYHVAVERRIEAHTLYDGYPGGVWVGPMWAETIIDEYELGTLLLDVIDPRLHEVIWRGRAQARVSELRSPEQRDALVRKVVAKLLALFPPE